MTRGRVRGAEEGTVGCTRRGDMGKVSGKKRRVKGASEQALKMRRRRRRCECGPKGLDSGRERGARREAGEVKREKERENRGRRT